MDAADAVLGRPLPAFKEQVWEIQLEDARDERGGETRSEFRDARSYRSCELENVALPDGWAWRTNWRLAQDWTRCDDGSNRRLWARAREPLPRGAAASDAPSAVNINGHANGNGTRESPPSPSSGGPDSTVLASTANAREEQVLSLLQRLASDAAHIRALTARLDAPTSDDDLVPHRLRAHLALGDMHAQAAEAVVRALEHAEHSQRSQQLSHHQETEAETRPPAHEMRAASTYLRGDLARLRARLRAATWAAEDRLRSRRASLRNAPVTVAEVHRALSKLDLSPQSQHAHAQPHAQPQPPSPAGSEQLLQATFAERSAAADIAAMEREMAEMRGVMSHVAAEVARQGDALRGAEAAAEGGRASARAAVDALQRAASGGGSSEPPEAADGGADASCRLS